MSKQVDDPSARQLEVWHNKNKDKGTYTTTDAGAPLPYKDSSLTIGQHGLIPLTDWNLLEQLGHFNRERIPERVVHAKGAGAFGYFEVTDDITDVTSAKMFETIGKKTPMAVRFSQVAGNLGSADTVRDPRGFALKFYTEDGIWDLVGNNTPIFFIRDPILFPMFIHSQKRNPSTNLRDMNMFWDFISLRPESLNQVIYLFSDKGIPDGHRHMDGFGSSTFSMIRNKTLTWVKFHYLTDQGIKNLDQDEANRIAGIDPDYAVRDLYDAISRNEFPSWTFYIQTMSTEQAKTLEFDAFDLTKTWPTDRFPLRRVGRFVLNRNPVNFFAEIEQLAFQPSNFVPGISDSPDRMLQGRMFSYPDTHRYRLGVNYQQIPVNCPFQVKNFQRDGLSTINSQGGAPNYHPNSFGGPEVKSGASYTPYQSYTGEVKYWDLRDQDNYSQSRERYLNLDVNERRRLAKNVATMLKMASSNEVKARTISEFEKVDKKLGSDIRSNM